MEQGISIVAAPARDYTMWSLALQADPVVKGVMILLVLASVACWAIIFEKVVKIWWLKRSIHRLATAAGSYRQGDLVHTILEAGKREADIDHSDSPAEKRHRVEAAMRSTLKFEMQRLEVGLPFLATIGSAAPFIGLFGTVWGIVNSFTAIAQQKDTSLAVVAPGIAEALIATALGLAAAIPAVMAYNQIAVALGRAYAAGNRSIVAIVRAWIASEARPKAKPSRGATVEPFRAGKHP